MAQKITKRVVDELQPGESATFVWDSEIKGFGVRCRPSGGKFYILKTRVGRRQRWLTIGRHGSPWTPDRAREEARRLLGQKADGKDPASERDKRKAAVTIKELADRFMSDHVAHRSSRKTAYEYGRTVERLIVPTLGQHAISDIARSDVSRFHHDLRAAPYQANRALAVLSKMMNLAEEWGLRPDGSNPCRHVKKNKENKRERFLNREELRRLAEVLEDAAHLNTENPFVIVAFRLLILTGARLNEIVTLKWDFVDLENHVLRLPTSKTGAKVIYLNDDAVELLRTLPRMHENPYVIAGQKPGSHMVEMQKPWRRIRSAAGLDDVRIHDLRHTFASVAVGSGMGLPMIGKLLGHTQAQTTARYAHLADDPVRAASNQIGADLTVMMTTPKAVEKKRERVRLDE